MIGRHHIGLLGQALLMLGVVDLPPPREPEAPRGPGRQLRDERERVGEPIRILAAYTGLTAVEIGEFERGVAVPTSEQWAQLQDALPGLGAMEAPTRAVQATAGELRERGLTLPADIPDRTRMVVGIDTGRSLHPAGRCTCGGGGGGSCEWCVMDRARADKAAAVERNRRETLELRRDLRPQQAAARKTKAARKARRGF